MIEFANLNQVEALFDEMEPGNQEGGGFTPSLHQDEIRLDDSSIELEMEEEIRDYEDAHLGLFTPFEGSDIPVPLAAVDVGVVDLGLTRTGFALAFKGAVVMQNIDGTHEVAKIGPRLKFITPENRADLLHFIGRQLGSDTKSG